MIIQKIQLFIYLICMIATQQAFSEERLKKITPDIYMVNPNGNFNACLGGCKNNIPETGGWNASAIKLNASDFDMLGATINVISNSICSASDKIAGYTVSLSLEGGAVYINGAAGIAVEVQCK